WTVQRVAWRRGGASTSAYRSTSGFTATACAPAVTGRSRAASGSGSGISRTGHPLPLIGQPQGPSVGISARAAQRLRIVLLVGILRGNPNVVGQVAANDTEEPPLRECAEQVDGFRIVERDKGPDAEELGQVAGFDLPGLGLDVEIPSSQNDSGLIVGRLVLPSE